jgi:hypothetical protein
MLLTLEVKTKLATAPTCLLESPALNPGQGPSRSDVQVREGPLTDCWPSHRGALCPTSRPRGAPQLRGYKTLRSFPSTKHFLLSTTQTSCKAGELFVKIDHSIAYCLANQPQPSLLDSYLTNLSRLDLLVLPTLSASIVCQSRWLRPRQSAKVGRSFPPSIISPPLSGTDRLTVSLSIVDPTLFFLPYHCVITYYYSTCSFSLSESR